MPLTTPMKTATFLVRLTPEERERLHAMAADRRISLAEAMREGAKLYLQDVRAKRDQLRDSSEGVGVAT